MQGAAGMAGELGHVHIPMQGLLAEGQPLPQCNCGFDGDAESVASLTGIEKNLLPYWLARYPGARAGRGAHRARRRSSCALRREGRPDGRCIFEQQAMAIGRLFTIAANFTDPQRLLRGRRRGRDRPASSASGSWARCGRTRSCARSRRARRDFALVPDLDMAGARGAALAALAVAARQSVDS